MIDFKINQRGRRVVDKDSGRQGRITHEHSGGWFSVAWDSPSSHTDVRGDNLMTPNRMCFHADESFQDPRTGHFHVIRIDEGEPGYAVVESHADLDKSQTIAKAMNDRLNLSADEVLDIRCSSMAAHMAGHRTE